MTAATEVSRKNIWTALGWFGALVFVCYAPVLRRLLISWNVEADMGHGYFVPLVAGFMLWQRRSELLTLKARPSWWGLPPVVLGGIALIFGTLGVELFITRVALLLTLMGAVWMLGGTLVLRKTAFPLCLLLLMIPIPTIAYNAITFPLQLLASKLAAGALSTLGIPVLREGNILELPNQRLSVVEACSGIRSLLSLAFLSLVYGYFFEKRTWIRVVLFLATVPIAVIANAGRVTFTGLLGQVKPELAEGFFHESTGWVIFISALLILILFHQLIRRLTERRGVEAASVDG